MEQCKVDVRPVLSALGVEEAVSGRHSKYIPVACVSLAHSCTVRQEIFVSETFRCFIFENFQ